MTYVPTPYLDIAEDLLTALTGGVVREEDTFSSDTMEYYFEDFPVEPQSVRIVGILEKEFHNFVAGQDFDADSEKITWRNDGDLPDEWSKFYINYYKNYVEPVLSDRNVGSVTRTLAESFAREFAVLYQQLLLIYESGFINTAKGSSLDQVVAILGNTYERKRGDYATGDVLFYRNSPATANIFIKEGVQVATKTEELKIYETSQEKTFRKGQISVLVPIRAVEKGQDGVTEAGTIKIMVQPVMGIDGVLNPKEISPTGMEETDEELIERAKYALEAAGKTTTNALKYSLLSIPELWGKDIRVEEDFNDGNGLVRVYIDAEGTGDLVDKIDRKIFETKAAGIKVIHNLSKSEEDISAKLKVDLKKVSVTLRAVVSLEDPSISSSEKEKIKGQVSSVIKNYFSKLKIGESVSKNRLIARILSVAGIKDVPVTGWDLSPSPAAPSENEIGVDENEKIELQGEPWIAITDSPVFVDVKIESLIIDETLEQDNVEKSLKDKTNAFIGGLGKKMSYKDFMDALKMTGCSLTLVFDIEHSESGLIIHDVKEEGEDIPASIHETFVLRSIQIQFL